MNACKLLGFGLFVVGIHHGFLGNTDKMVISAIFSGIFLVSFGELIDSFFKDT